MADTATESPPDVDEPAGEPADPGQADPGQADLLKLTDLGNAERLIRRHGKDLRYCHPWHKWLVWDGRRWKLDDTAEVWRRATDTIRHIYLEAASIDNPDVRAAVGKHAFRSESADKTRAMLAHAMALPGVPVLPDELDRDPWALNLTNGTLNLRTSRLRPHRQRDLITKLSPVAYDPDATAPLWSAFLDRIMQSNPDLLDYLQITAGYTLTGLTSEQALFMAHGVGANGKSVYLNTLSALLGEDYAQQAHRDLLLSRQQGIPNDIARLRGARLVNVIETGEGRRLDEELVKQLTGGDKISARYLHAEFFDFTPQCKVYLATNHKPRIKGTDHGIWRRIRLVPFEAVIPDDQQDKELTTKLRAELPGILAWAVRGCRTWQDLGLETPEAIRKATEHYRAEQDALGEFIAARCVLDANAHAYARELWDAYTAFTGDHISQRALGLLLAERGFDQTTLGHGNRRAWLGIGLAATTDDTVPLSDQEP